MELEASSPHTLISGKQLKAVIMCTRSSYNYSITTVSSYHSNTIVAGVDLTPWGLKQVALIPLSVVNSWKLSSCAPEVVIIIASPWFLVTIATQWFLGLISLHGAWTSSPHTLISGKQLKAVIMEWMLPLYRVHRKWLYSITMVSGHHSNTMVSGINLTAWSLKQVALIPLSVVNSWRLSSWSECFLFTMCTRSRYIYSITMVSSHHSNTMVPDHKPVITGFNSFCI